jgi:hypothetical protein
MSSGGVLSGLARNVCELVAGNAVLILATLAAHHHGIGRFQKCYRCAYPTSAGPKDMLQQISITEENTA